MTVESPEELRPLAVGSEPPAPVVSVSPTLRALAAATLAASLAACGGGGGASPSPAPEPPPPPPPPPPAAPTEAEASRFLAQASMGGSRTEIATVVSLGYAGWLDAQFALPVTDSRWDWLVTQGYTAFTHKND